MSTYQIIINCL